MSPSGRRYAVFWAPLDAIPGALHSHGHYLLRACEVSEMSLSDALGRVVSGRARLALCFGLDPVEPRGVAVAQPFEDERGLILEMHTMAGEELLRWSWQLNEMATAWARELGCYAGRFHGRRGLSRAYPDCNIIGYARPGLAVYEKVL